MSNTEYLTARRIDRPAYAGEADVEIEDDEGGQESHDAFQPHVDAILQRLHRMLERELNDPDRVFLDESEGFPVKSELSGEYYAGDTSYHGDDDCHVMSIMLNCLEKKGGQWGDNPPVDDYLGMEMVVYLDRKTGEVTTEDYFNKSVI